VAPVLRMSDRLMLPWQRLGAGLCGGSGGGLAETWQWLGGGAAVAWLWLCDVWAWFGGGSAVAWRRLVARGSEGGYAQSKMSVHQKKRWVSKLCVSISGASLVVGC